MRSIDPIRFAAFLLPLSVVGCGSDTPQPASGTVSVDGKPAQGVVVTLIPTQLDGWKRTSYPRGEVGADGKYALTTDASSDGAPPGEYKLTLRWPVSLAGKTKALAAAQGDGGETDRLKGKYADPKTTPWSVSIRNGENALPSISIPER